MELKQLFNQCSDRIPKSWTIEMLGYYLCDLHTIILQITFSFIAKDFNKRKLALKFGNYCPDQSLRRSLNITFIETNKWQFYIKFPN